MSRKVAIISTNSLDNFIKTKGIMISTFLNCWPEKCNFYDECNLFFYCENFDLKKIPERVKTFNIYERIPDLLNFKKRNSDIDYLNGYREKEKYNILYDFVKFSHKSYVMVDALLNFEDYDIIIWLDCDTLTHTKVNDTLFEYIYDENSYVSYLGRDFFGFRKLYTETGFLLFNRRNSFALEHARRVKNIYDNDLYEEVFQYTSKNYQCGGYTDCHVFDYVKDQLVNEGAKILNISKIFNIPSSHPFINSILGWYFDHFKGDRKEKLISLKKDIRWKQLLNHPYWRKRYEDDKI